MTLRANERGQIQKKPEQNTGDGKNFGDAVDQQNREDDHGEEESPFGGFLPKLASSWGVAFGGQTRAKRREQARNAGEDLLGISDTVEVLLRAANQAKIEKSLARDKKEKSRERRERAQAKGKEKIAEMAGITELGGSTQATGAEELFRLRRGIGASPGVQQQRR
jgi:hypothetical protein